MFMSLCPIPLNQYFELPIIMCKDKDSLLLFFLCVQVLFVITFVTMKFYK